LNSDQLYDIAAGQLPPGGLVKCGNRRDLVKKQRRHRWQDLGETVMHGIEGTMRACQVCGTTEFHRGIPETL